MFKPEMKQCNIIFVMVLLFLSLHGVCVDSRNINSVTHNTSTSAGRAPKSFLKVHSDEVITFVCGPIDAKYR